MKGKKEKEDRTEKSFLHVLFRFLFDVNLFLDLFNGKLWSSQGGDLSPKKQVSSWSFPVDSWWRGSDVCKGNCQEMLWVLKFRDTVCCFNDCSTSSEPPSEISFLEGLLKGKLGNPWLILDQKGSPQMVATSCHKNGLQRRFLWKLKRRICQIWLE